MPRRAAFRWWWTAVSALGRRGGGRDARRHRDLFFFSQQVPAFGFRGVVPVCGAGAVAAVGIARPHASITSIPLRYRRYQRELVADPVHPGGIGFLRSRDGPRRAAPSRGECRAAARPTASATFASAGCSPTSAFESFTNTGRESHTISTLRLPDFLKVAQLYERLKERGFVIYKCKGRSGGAARSDRQHGRAARRDHRRLLGGGYRGGRSGRAAKSEQRAIVPPRRAGSAS